MSFTFPMHTLHCQKIMILLKKKVYEYPTTCISWVHATKPITKGWLNLVLIANMLQKLDSMESQRITENNIEPANQEYRSHQFRSTCKPIIAQDSPPRNLSQTYGAWNIIKHLKQSSCLVQLIIYSLTILQEDSGNLRPRKYQKTIIGRSTLLII